MSHDSQGGSPEDLLRVADVRRIAGGVSNATIYRWIAEGRFPAPYKPTSHTSVWKRGEIERWKAELSRDDDSTLGAV